MLQPHPAVRPVTLALPALLLGSTVLAFGPLLVRLAEVGPDVSAFYRVSLAALPLFLLVRLSGQRLPARRAWPALALGGLFFAADLLLWHAGILRTTLANATLFGNVASFGFAAYGFLVARRPPTRLASLALVIAAIGTALLLGRSAELSPEHLRGDLLCIGAGLCYTGYLIVIERSRAAVAALPALAVATVSAALVTFPAAWAAPGTMIPRDWTPLVLLALGSQVLGQGLVVYAVGLLRPLVSGLGLLTQPVVAAGIGWLWFGEVLGALDLVGASLIGAALVLVRLR